MQGTPDAGALEQPRDQFCMGMGSVGSFGSDNTCSGELAESTFQFALCACERIVVSSQLSLDAFDSKLGAYGVPLGDGGVNIRDDGHLGVNQGPLMLDKKLTVAGSAYISGGGAQFGPQTTISRNMSVYGNTTGVNNTSVVVGRNAFVHGNLGAQYTVQGNLTVPPGAMVNGTVLGTTTRAEFPDNPPCPCGANEVLDIAGLTQWAATHNDNDAVPGFDPNAWAMGTGPGSVTLPCGRFYVTSILAANSFTVNATGRVVLFVDGDFTAGGLNINAMPGAEVDLFIRGNLTITSAASFGSPAAPSLVRTYVGGNITASASSTFAGNIYAPNAVVNFSAASQIYGAIFAREVRFGAQSSVHFDSAIRRAGDACQAARDGGVPDAAVPDAGRVDAGGSVDAGGPPCMGLCDRTSCNALACVPSGSSFMCARCQSDLDCCAPDICEPLSGICYNPN